MKDSHSKKIMKQSINHMRQSSTHRPHHHSPTQTDYLEAVKEHEDAIKMATKTKAKLLHWEAHEKEFVRSSFNHSDI